MAVIRPFRALRPPRHLVERVAAPPYDVVDVDEARALAAGNPDSFLHVSRPEIDLPPGVDPHSRAVHERGRATLTELRSRGVLVPDAGRGLLVYRQQMGDAVQTGVVCCTSVAAYESGAIATHEHTRPDKELDRARHIDALDAHDEPVFLMYREDTAGASDVAALIATMTAGPAEYELTGDDGIRHTLWTVTDPEVVAGLVAAFGRIPTLYVADGHHRTAAAARVHAHRTDPARSIPDALTPAASGEPAHPTPTGEPEVPSAGILSVVFPADQLTILAYNRVVTDLGGHTPETLLAALGEVFDVAPVPTAVPDAPHRVGMYLAGRWYLLTARDGTVDEANPIARLDVSLLQDRVLSPLLGIADPRTDPRISFVGGIRGADELARLVDSGRAAVAFTLHPTSPSEVMDVADRGEVMPPKSTWFEPKLRSGLFLHPLS
ncbi:MAG: DUF1015 domain-containing protein [Actinomycetales bacterium]|nr:DUF1015 domain-containing protein [Actinomycetales bacterium]